MSDTPTKLLLYVGVACDVVIELTRRNGAPEDLSQVTKFSFFVRPSTDADPVIEYETADANRIHDGTDGATDPSTLTAEIDQQTADDLVPGIYMGQARILVDGKTPVTVPFDVTIRQPLAELDP